jgi:ATP-dependent Clp protease ATP-binding subunit ClpA
MPKINVYLPDDLAVSVRQAGIPVSPVCQQALVEAVRKVTRVRKVVDVIRNQVLSPDQMTKIGRAAALTDRLRSAIGMADRRAAAAGTKVTTGQLLLGLLDEGHNFAVSLLEALDVDLDDLRSSIEAGRPGDAETGEPRVAGDHAPASVWRNLSWPAWNAVAAAMEATVGFGHNYVGCEHLLIGLLDDPDNQAGQVLRGYGVDSANVRRMLPSAVAGFKRGRQADGSIADQLDRIVSRLEGIEQRLTAIGA